MATLTKLAAVALGDTTLPGLIGRRVWSAPAVTSHAWLVMTAAKLVTVPASHATGDSPDPNTQRAIDAGADLDGLFGPAATVVNLFEVRRVELDLATLTIDVTHRAGAGAGVETLHFRDAETADDVFAKLLHHTRDRLRLTGGEPGGWATLRAPLGLLGAIALATLTLAVTVSAAADLAPPPGEPSLAPPDFARWLTLLSTLDWRWVCGLGGAAAAWVQVELYRRYHRAPTRLALVPLS